MAIYPLPKPIPSDFEARFANWLRWCRSGGVRVFALECESIEHVYAGPQGKGCPTGWGDYDESSLPKRSIPEPIDMDDGALLNRVYVYELDPRPRKVIKVIWFERLRPEAKARKLECKPDELRLVGDVAKIRFGQALASARK